MNRLPPSPRVRSRSRGPLWRRLLVLSVMLAWIVPAGGRAAPAPVRPLGLQEVIDAVESRHPQLDAARGGLAVARADRFGARGVWDPTVRVGARWLPVGYYDNGQVDASLRQATPLWGLGLYAGYRLGFGTYPVYKGQLQTLSGGEFRAGLDLPIWKDGPIDPGRAEIRKTRLLARAEICEVQGTRLALGRDAARAYWRWVATGREVEIQRELLDVAERRDAALGEQAGLGAIAPIVVTDNRRLVLDRQSKLVEAKRAFGTASLSLSLFLRDRARRPIRVHSDRLPATIPAEVDVRIPDDDGDVEQALRRRPELCKLELLRSAAAVDVRLAKNQRAPDLNAQVFVSRDVGDGPADLRPTEAGVGVVFEMPLALRKARGAYRAATAKVARLDAELRGLRDRIAVEVRQARVDLRAAAQQVGLADEQLAAARTLARAEADKFDEGASDLVIVNLRELQAADAARLRIEALEAYQAARADYLTAIGRGV